MEVESDPTSEAASELSRLLDTHYIERLKLACSGIRVVRSRMEELDNQFINVFGCLKVTLSTPEAVAFSCQVLHTLGYNRTEKLRRSVQEVIPGFDYKSRFPRVDCILTVIDFLDDLGKQDFSNVRSYVCNHTRQTTDHVKSRVDLVNVLFSEELISETNFEFIYQIAKKFNRSRFFDTYRKRHQALLMKGNDV